MTSAIPDLDATLEAFAEAGADDATLADYVRRYPQFAGELIDFAQELRAVEADDAAPYTPDTAWETESWARFAKAAGVARGGASVADPFATLNSARQVEIRQTLGVPSMVFNAFRDRQVDPGTVPEPFLARFAQLLSIASQELRAALTAPARLDPAMQYKADGKPAAAADKVAFADLLDQAMVPADRRAALLRDEA
jgi:hypothetical protein